MKTECSQVTYSTKCFALIATHHPLGCILNYKKIVAICDIYQPYLDFAAGKVGGSPRQFKDYRRLLDQQDLDGSLVDLSTLGGEGDTDFLFVSGGRDTVSYRIEDINDSRTGRLSWRELDLDR